MKSDTKGNQVVFTDGMFGLLHANQGGLVQTIRLLGDRLARTKPRVEIDWALKVPGAAFQS